ncbi:MAG TPA: 4-hydroxy-tetrahydrodipicolinate reductase [Candidatus Eisenbergiella intestinipullorum]|nr:4-hydroxy-tetrahydrodipicolinate reductase [Candidatus Eisenbergiella intestinipullorum]
MVKILIHGCCGHMGQVVARLAEEDSQLQTVAGVDPFPGGAQPWPVYPSLKDYREKAEQKADVIVDFSSAKAVDDLLSFCEETNTACVLCTTGLSAEQLARVEEVSQKAAILKSANMSLGINLLQNLLKKAASVLAEAGFDIEIVEKHHNRKLDAPSGTAIALADSINEELDGAYHYIYDRSTRRQKRDEKEIGISAVRGGTIVGEHDVIFAGEDEVITFSHRAYSRNVFAKGALQAAKFLKDRPAGLYDMSDVIGG